MTAAHNSALEKNRWRSPHTVPERQFLATFLWFLVGHRSADFAPERQNKCGTFSILLLRPISASCSCLRHANLVVSAASACFATLADAASQPCIRGTFRLPKCGWKRRCAPWHEDVLQSIPQAHTKGNLFSLREPYRCRGAWGGILQRHQARIPGVRLSVVRVKQIAEFGGSQILTLQRHPAAKADMGRSTTIIVPNIGSYRPVIHTTGWPAQTTVSHPEMGGALELSSIPTTLSHPQVPLHSLATDPNPSQSIIIQKGERIYASIDSP